MLRLAEKVGRNQGRVGAVVGDNEDLGGTCRQIDAHETEQLPLGLGDVGVAGTGDHVDRAHADATVGHRAQRLHAAKCVDFVCSRFHQGIKGCRKDAFRAARRCGADHMRNAGHLGGGNTHDGSRDQRVLAARDVAADCLDRNDLLAEHDAGADLGFELLQRVALPFCELGDLLLAEGKVVFEDGAHRLAGGIDLRLGHAKLRAVPAVEVLGIAPHGCVAVLLDVIEHRTHALGKSTISLARRRFGLLKEFHHNPTPCEGPLHSPCNRLHLNLPSPSFGCQAYG